MPYLPPIPADEDVEYVQGEMACSFDELIEALQWGGADVRRGLVTDEGAFIEQAND